MPVGGSTFGGVLTKPWSCGSSLPFHSLYGAFPVVTPRGRHSHCTSIWIRFFYLAFPHVCRQKKAQNHVSMQRHGTGGAQCSEFLTLKNSSASHPKHDVDGVSSRSPTQACLPAPVLEQMYYSIRGRSIVLACDSLQYRN